MAIGASLTVQLAEFRCPGCSVAGHWRAVARPRLRANSRTGVVACASCGRRAFVKTVLGAVGESGEELARRMFTSAVEAQRTFSGFEEFGVPTPWHQNGATLVFAYVDGHSPTPVLRSGPVLTATKLASSLGEWFAIYHTSESGTPAGLSPVKPLTETLPTRLRGLVDAFSRGGPHDDLVGTALRDLHCRIRSLPPEPGRVVRIHGDPKPDNFLIAARRVIGLDIDGMQWGEPENDLAQFDIQMRLTLTHRWGRARSASDRVRLLSSATIEGYQQRGQLDVLRLGTLRLMYLLALWSSWRAAGPIARLRWDPLFSASLRQLLATG